MASRTTYPKQTPKTDVWQTYQRLQGAGAADMANLDGQNSEVVTATRSGAGTFALVFRRLYPQGLFAYKPSVVGTTTGLSGTYTAWDPVAGTATLLLSVGGVATDPATTDQVFLSWDVRNSGRN